jgi:uncharacterized membrane protein
MEVMALLLIIIILFIVIAIKSSLNDKFRDLNSKIEMLSDRLKKLAAEQPIAEKRSTEQKKSPEESIAHRTYVVPEKPVTLQGEKAIQPQPIPHEEPRPVPPITPKPVVADPVLAATSEPERSKPQTKIPTPSFFEKNPDLEKFIGENLANKIGIAILVLGIGFFVKFAIDQNWINEIGRVFIGILCGGILLAIAHRLRKTFNAFSSVLVGGGIAVLYFTIAIAFHEYGIFSQTAAFILMVGITAFTIVLSIGYNRVELAVFAILGGFGSPFMVSTGEGNYIVLFTYMLILNGGMLVLAYHKKWKIINIICYAFTIIIYGGWLSDRFDGANPSMIQGALIFATLFYLVFFAMNIINNIRQRAKFEATEIFMLLSNTFLYYSAGIVILNNEIADDFRGLFTAALGIFNFVFAYLLYKNARADRNLVFMLIGLVLTFISLAAPIQLEGNYITLFWAAEAVLLLWLSQKSGIALMKIASVIVTALMAISLMMDWKQIYIENAEDVSLNIIFNKGYITSVVSIASLVFVGILLRNEQENKYFKPADYRTIITICTAVFVYTAHLLELRYHIGGFVERYDAQTVIIGCYNMFFILLIMMAEEKLSVPDQIKSVFPFWGIVAMVAYAFFYHEQVIDSRNDYLTGTSGSTGFMAHYVLVGLLIANVVLSLNKLNARTALTEAFSNLHWWLYVIFFLFIASAELDHTVLITAYNDQQTFDHILKQNHKIGFPILWGIAAFLLIVVGLKRKIKMLRIISLALLLTTLLKLFIFDLKGISEGGKIAAFISLGILLLVVSFMYQRLKKILLEDSASQNETEKVV